LKKEAIYIISFYLKNNDEIIRKDNIESKIKKDELLFEIDKDKYKINLSKFILNKDNNESTLNFIFDDKKETKGIYYIKDMNFYMDARIKTNKLIYKDNKLDIDYELYLQDEYIGKFRLKITVKE
jgi:hypothetical protein